MQFMIGSLTFSSAFKIVNQEVYFTLSFYPTSAPLATCLLHFAIAELLWQHCSPYSLFIPFIVIDSANFLALLKHRHGDGYGRQIGNDTNMET